MNTQLEKIFDLQEPRDFQRTLFTISLNLNHKGLSEHDSALINETLTKLFDVTEEYIEHKRNEVIDAIDLTDK
jgi:predicted HAD superfamily phosphohydrolase